MDKLLIFSSAILKPVDLCSITDCDAGSGSFTVGKEREDKRSHHWWKQAGHAHACAELAGGAKLSGERRDWV